jgi:hypothetical protein
MSIKIIKLIIESLLWTVNGMVYQQMCSKVVGRYYINSLHLVCVRSILVESVSLQSKFVRDPIW